jgi:hypothetical protein
MKKLILPKDGVAPRPEKNEHLYFLAGPSRGNNWRAEAINIISKKDSDCCIVNPNDKEFIPCYMLPNRTLWERHYMEIASHYGCIIFWLPKPTFCTRLWPQRLYGRDTYGELGRWSIRNAYQIDPPVKLVIGAEEEFPGLKIIQRNLNADHEREFTIYHSLEETINQAIILASKG